MRLRFLFKIHSGYDGFRPAVIEKRLDADGLVPLGWHRYFDDAERGSEVWVYFHGPHKFENGVYIKGVVQRRDPATSTVYLRPTEYSTQTPLTDAATVERVASAVGTRYRQVFFFPEALAPDPECDLDVDASTCAAHLCQDCARWQRFPVIGDGSSLAPERLRTEPDVDFRAGYWVIPSRCAWNSASIPPGVHDTSNLFYRFKVGDVALAFPLAASIHRAMRSDGVDLDTIDRIIPVPLSPHKIVLKELHRTRALATCLSHLTGIPVNEAVALREPISKRRLMLDEGWTTAQFEVRYRELLEVADSVRELDSVVILDDVATRGSTLRCMVRALRAVKRDIEILAVTAGQMILTATCRALP